MDAAGTVHFDQSEKVIKANMALDGAVFMPLFLSERVGWTIHFINEPKRKGRARG